jgi:hypothetical protein
VYELVCPSPRFRETQASYAQRSAKHHHHHIIDQHHEIDDIAFIVAFYKMSQTFPLFLIECELCLLYLWDASTVTKTISRTQTKSTMNSYNLIENICILRFDISYRMHTLYMNWVKASKMKVYHVPFSPLFKQSEY